MVGLRGVGFCERGLSSGAGGFHALARCRLRQLRLQPAQDVEGFLSLAVAHFCSSGGRADRTATILPLRSRTAFSNSPLSSWATIRFSPRIASRTVNSSSLETRNLRGP